MMNILDKYLVADWRQSWRWTSVQIAAVASAVGGVVTSSPDVLLALIQFLPAGGWVRTAMIALVVVTIFVVPTVARLWDQGEDHDETE